MRKKIINLMMSSSLLWGHDLSACGEGRLLVCNMESRREELSGLINGVLSSQS